MTSIADCFRTLLQNINPPADRRDMASRLPGEVRAFLKDHEFETESPHTRLTGSYFRDTAILGIKDVDVLLFVPESQTARTPNAVLLDVKKVLESYPDAKVEVSGQRRSVRLTLTDESFQIDIVPTHAPNETNEPLFVPDRPQKDWIDSNPLGYSDRLTNLNQDHGGKVVPLIKLLKAWSDAQGCYRKPKSYVLEAHVYYAVKDWGLAVTDRGWAEIVADLFDLLWDRYEELFTNGTESPRLPDPGLIDLEGYTAPLITKGWERAHFETFMRRVKASRSAAQAAVKATDLGTAKAKWKDVFGDHWPEEEAVKAMLRELALSVQPGTARVGQTGLVIGISGASVLSPPTRNHGD
jgi:Second Messenger Oligonucleotide or Dinucleotide Synthetase domain